MTYYRKINDVEFDAVFTILSGGTITDGPAGIDAPESHDGELMGDGWEYVNGYSGQYGYRGPIMHSSEYIGGGMERDMLSTPGIYAVVADYTASELSADDIPADFPVRPFPDDSTVEYLAQFPDATTCMECGLVWDDGKSTSLTPVPAGRCPFEYFHGSGASEPTGWAVVRYTGNLPTRGRYIGLWSGGASYSGSEWTDAEWFLTLADAAAALRERESGRGAPFRYVVRADDRTDTPCAHSDWSGGITLYRINDSVTPDEVEMMIGEEYPDRIIEFGPRGGIRYTRT